MRLKDRPILEIIPKTIPTGIVSESDLTGAISPYLRPQFAKWRRPLDNATLKIRIKWTMTSTVHTVPPEASLAAIMENMHRLGTRCLPVMDRQGKVQGLVTVFDVFKALLPAANPKHLFCRQSTQNAAL